jgi:uncharacterized protein (TIGR02145 family)
MKKNIILIAALIFASWGCDKDRILDPPFQRHQVITQMQDTTKSSQQMQETGNAVQGVVLFEFNDFDGNIYHAIQIGTQIWSQENLKTTHYNDGTPIPNVLSTSEWTALTSGAYCHYNNNPSKSDIYGLLYNYFAVATNKLAPKGWHVATIDDWNKLFVEAGLEKPNGFDVGPLVNAKDWRAQFYLRTRNWEEEAKPITCTNGTGFTALPNGYRDNSISPDFPEFDCLGGQASWWTSNGTIFYLDGTFGVFPRDDRPRYVGSGIRLVKDADYIH